MIHTAFDVADWIARDVSREIFHKVAVPGAAGSGSPGGIAGGGLLSKGTTPGASDGSVAGGSEISGTGAGGISGIASPGTASS